eukprot:2263664-Pyramimonas_sp.AAC.1
MGGGEACEPWREEGEGEEEEERMRGTRGTVSSKRGPNTTGWFGMNLDLFRNHFGSSHFGSRQLARSARACLQARPSTQRLRGRPFWHNLIQSHFRKL